MSTTQTPLTTPDTAYQMSQDAANQYALRMFNDDAWDKQYTPSLDLLQYTRHEDESVGVSLPVTLKLERHCVPDDDDEEYADRPDAFDSALAQDDQGVINLPFVLNCLIPAGFQYQADIDTETYIKKLGFVVGDIDVATMYEGKIELSQDALDHLINRIGESYMVLDTLVQNENLLKSIFY